MAPIRKGDGTAVVPKGISQVRTGDGRILFDGPAIPDSGLIQNYDATELNLNNEDEVQTWPDESGTGNDANAVGSPTYEDSGINGKPGVIFDGVNDYFEINDVTMGNEHSLFAVIASEGNDSKYLYGGGYDNPESYLILSPRGSDNDRIGYATTDNFDAVDFSHDITGSLEILSLIRESNGETSVYIDGNFIDTKSTANISEETYDHHIGYALPRDNDGTQWEGRMGQMLQYNRAVNDSERETIEKELSTKWGVSI